jgi:hypothetical protein
MNDTIELKDIKNILQKYQNKIKNDENKVIEMNKYIEQIQKYLAKQKSELQNIYSFVDNYGLLMKKQQEADIEPTIDEYLASLEQIKEDIKKLL